MYPAPVVIEIRLGFRAGDQYNADSICVRDIRIGAGRHAGPVEDAGDATFDESLPRTGPLTSWPSAALASALLITVHDVAFPAGCPGGEGAESAKPPGHRMACANIGGCRLLTPHSLWVTNWAAANTHKHVRQPALSETAVVP